MADLKIAYAPGKRPPQGATADKWLHTIPDWRKEFPRCDNPPREDAAIYFFTQQSKRTEQVEGA